MPTDPRIPGAVAAVTLALIAIVVVAISPWSGGSSASGVLQGDADCSESIDSLDALAALRFAAGAEPFAGCVEQAADVNCDGSVNEGDVLSLLLFVGGVSPAQPASGTCPPIGEPLDGLATTAPPGTATATATASATPAANDYHLETVISSDALGAANGSVIELAVIPGAPTEAIVALQSGVMYRVSLDGSFAPQAWGDVSGIVNAGGEEGLLSLAFSPDFAEDGTVFAYYTPGSPADTVLARFDATRTDLDETSRETVISIEEHNNNHNGGRIVFDHQGYLMLSLGDGGWGGDALEVAQELDRLLGKVIRIDVSVPPYAIPPDNPFADGPGGNADEIFALGFRNPWRMTIDRLTGDVWLGDVGEGSWEEVDRVVAGGNYGWDCYEGFAEFEIPGVPDQCTGKTFATPRAVYDHSLGSAVTGGFVYRGSAMPELYGWYVYGDFYTGRIWAVDTLDDGAAILLTDEEVLIASFAELPNGELLIVSYTDGIYQLARD